jgi:hypothetical protein
MLGIFFSISRLLLLYPVAFDFIGLAGRNPAHGIGGTIPGNGALVAPHAAIVPDLQVQGTVPEGGTSFHTFATTNAKLLIDDIFEIGLLDKSPLDSRGGTELVLGPGFQLGAGFEVAAA